MKKLLALIVVAAMVGLVISRTRALSLTDPEQPAPPPQSDSSGPEGADDPVPLSAETGAGAVAEHPASSPATTDPSADGHEAAGGTDSTGVAVTTGDGHERAHADPPAADAEDPDVPEDPDEQAGRHPEVPLLKTALELLKKGDRLGARKLLSGLYRRSEGQVRQCARTILDAINKDLVFDPYCTEGATVHEVKSGEVLVRIAKKHGVNWRMIARLNAIDRPEILRAGRDLKIIKGPQGILVDKSEFRLALFIDGAFIKEYRIGIGKNDKTPAREFAIDLMQVNPDWYPPQGGIIRYGEKGHLIGDRWIGFRDEPGASGLGIHGTSDPKSIATKCSNGCIRLRNEDIIELYDFVTIGATVRIVE